ncbi:MAG: hypothetical protein R6U68_15585 [Desulfobacteraceae bacterium]
MSKSCISSKLLEQAFAKHKKRSLTLKQLCSALPVSERKRLGLEKNSEVKEIESLLKHISGPYAVIRKGSSTYIIGSPIEELVEALIKSTPGRTVGQLAQQLPVKKSDVISIANQLLEAKRLGALISPGELVKLYPAAPDQPVSSQQKNTTSEESAGISGDPVAAFKSAYDDLIKGKRHVYIYAIRRKLGWTRHEFDELLDTLLTKGRVAGFPGDPSRLASDQVKDSFQGRDGDLYIAVAWRR